MQIVIDLSDAWNSGHARRHLEVCRRCLDSLREQKSLLFNNNTTKTKTENKSQTRWHLFLLLLLALFVLPATPPALLGLPVSVAVSASPALVTVLPARQSRQTQATHS